VGRFFETQCICLVPFFTRSKNLEVAHKFTKKWWSGATQGNNNNNNNAHICIAQNKNPQMRNGTVR